MRSSSQAEGNSVPRKEERLVYKFEELSPEAKERAMEEYRNKGWDWDEHDTQMLTEYFEEQLEELGLPSGDVRWSLSYSQGDGVAFYGKVDIRDYVLKNNLATPLGFLSLIDALSNDEAEIVIEIEKSKTFHHYDHWNTMVVTSYVNTYGDPGIPGSKRWPRRVGRPVIERKTRELTEVIRKHVREISKKLEESGYREIEYKSSDEVISENIIANDYEFDEDGNFE